jgi:hypothetical protein
MKVQTIADIKPRAPSTMTTISIISRIVTSTDSNLSVNVRIHFLILLLPAVF